MISDHLLDEIRDRADIVEIVGEHVSLKRAGKEWRGLCPFHQERTPSFYVVPGKGFFKCFGCGESGDVFSFLMKHLGLSFYEAVRSVARRVGVEIPEESSTVPREDSALRALHEAIAFADDFFRTQLRDPAKGERARTYLTRRGISTGTADRFGLGYAPADWRALREAAGRHDIASEVLLEAGLIKASERTEEPYDRFRDRLMFPIQEVSGRTVAFGGRILGPSGDGVPKYLNSPETPIYHKGSVLFGLAWAKAAIRRNGSVVLVEGYMDYLSLAAHGIEHVAAPLGTSMTEEQARLVARYSKQALLLFDSDTAGLRATFRAADTLLAAGVHPLVVTLPQGEDPDSLVRARGADAVQVLLDGAVDVVDRKLQILEERGYFGSIEGVRKAVDGLLPTLRAVRDPALRDIYVARIAERTGVRRETLEREAVAADARGLRPVRAPASHGRRAEANTPGLAGQRKILLLLLRDPGRLPLALTELRPEDFTDPVYREIFEALEAGASAGNSPELLESLGDAARIRVEAMRADPEELSDGDRIFADSVVDVREERIFRRLDELETAIATAEAEGRGGDAQQLSMEKRDLMLSLRSQGYDVERLYRKRARGIRGTQTRQER